MRVAIVGYGNVGCALAGALLSAGHDVTFVAKDEDPASASAARESDPRLARASVAFADDAIRTSDLVILALPYSVAAAFVANHAATLDGRMVIDATNPVGPASSHAVGTRSGAQVIADGAPGARIVKCFNLYGAENLGGVPANGTAEPLMPLAGDDGEAKDAVAHVLKDLGWEPLDVGPLAAALDLEHLALLWIRLVRTGGYDGHLVWSALRWAPRT